MNDIQKTEALKKEHRNIVKAIDEAKVKLSETLRAINEAKGELSEVETAIKTANTAKEGAEKYEAEYKERMLATSKELDVAHERKLKIEKQIATLSVEVNQLEKYSDMTKGLIEQQQVNYKEIVGKVASAKENLEAYKATLEDKKKEAEVIILEKEKASDVVNDLVKRKEALAGDIESLSIEIENKESDLENIKVSTRNATLDLENALKQKKEVIDGIVVKNNEKGILEAELSELRGSIADLNSKIEQKKTELGDLVQKSIDLNDKEEYLRRAQIIIKEKYQKAGVEYQEVVI